PSHDRTLHARPRRKSWTGSGNHTGSAEPLMHRSTMVETNQDPKNDGCSCPAANEPYAEPSLLSGGSLNKNRRKISRMTGATLNLSLSSLAVVCLLAGCGPEPTATKTEPSAPADAPKPTALAVPEEIQSAAQSLLGAETQVLLFGDLAKTGKQQFLAANVVPKTSKNND